MIEIYFSEIRDLLVYENSLPSPLEIKEDEDRRVFIDGVTERTIGAFSIDKVPELLKIYEEGLDHRKMRSTDANEVSSRSH